MIEIQGINEVFEKSHGKDPLIIGAAKSCIGHTEFAAGLVGIVKAINTLKHQVVPGSVHLREDNINPSFDLSKVPLNIPTCTVDLPVKPANVPHMGLIL